MRSRVLSYTTNIIEVCLIVAVHVAIIEIHDPHDASTVDVGRGRPEPSGITEFAVSAVAV